MTTREPNVRIRPNVICTELVDEDNRLVAELTDKAIEQRVSYWERVKLNRAYPFRFSVPYLGTNNMTPTHIAQMAAFMREGSHRIWPDFDRFRPMPITRLSRRDVARATGVATIEDRVTATDDPQAPVTTESGPVSISPNTHSAPATIVDGEEDCSADSAEMRANLVSIATTSRLMVIAPPGTGKTHLLIDRLAWLLQRGGIDNPRDALLVLSFTRAAVSEIVRRVLGLLSAGMADDLRFVNVRTFDSFATEMLLRDLSAEDIAGLDYDARIERFTRMLNRPGDSKASEAVDRIRCLLVDEIQDLVGPRAEMVMALAKRIVERQGGVWLLGDPAQAIYDWQAESHPVTSRVFLAGVRDILGDTRSEVQLSTYHRFSAAKVVELVRNARRAMGPDGTQPDGSALLRLVASIGEPVPLEEVCAAIRNGQRAAILTRSNLEAYQAATFLRARGADILLGDESRRWPAWIARLLFGFEHDAMSREMAARRWNTFVASNAQVNFAEAWAYLVAEGLAHDDRLDVRRLSYRVQQRAPSPPEHAGARSLVSTIHRSKGLEFDVVYILCPNNQSQGDPEELRILYVAATRAKTSLTLLKRDAAIFYWGRKRWLSRFHIRRKGQHFLLLDGLDCLDVESVVTVGGASVRATKTTQDALWQRFAGFQGHIETVSRHEGRVFCLAPTVDGAGDICRVSPDLASDMSQLARSYRRSAGAPVRLGRVPVPALATVGLRDTPGAQERLGSAACALVPVTYGEALVIMGEDDAYDR